MMKQNANGSDHWGRAYTAIPKNVFAVVAWHLANVASGTADAPGAAKQRFSDELTALYHNGIISKAQWKVSLQSLINSSPPSVS